MRFTIERSRTLHRGRVYTLVNRDVRYDDGGRSSLDIIEHPGAVAIVPLLPDRQVLLIRQIRVAAGGVLLEIPAGTREPGEAPGATARRELIEETGFRAGRLRKIAAFFPAPGFCSEFIHVYAADRLTPAQGAQDPDERIRVHPVPLSRIPQMIESGRICDAKSIIGLRIVLSEQKNRGGGNR